MVLRIPKLFKLLQKQGKNGNHANAHNNSNNEKEKEEKKEERKEEHKEEKKEERKEEKKEEKKEEHKENAAPPWVARGEFAPVPKKIKFLFVSIEALIGDMALIVKNEGHDVRYSISDKDSNFSAATAISSGTPVRYQ